MPCGMASRVWCASLCGSSPEKSVSRYRTMEWVSIRAATKEWASSEWKSAHNASAVCCAWIQSQAPEPSSLFSSRWRGRKPRRTLMKQIRILLADDHTVIRAGIRLLLERQPEIQVVGEASDGRETVEA